MWHVPTWSTIGSFAGGAGFVAFVGVITNFLLSKRKQSDGVALELVKAQGQRIERLEWRAEKKDLIYEMKFQALRHRANGLADAFKALMTMIKIAPERATEFVALAEADREKQLLLEAAENRQLAALMADLARGEAAWEAGNRPDTGDNK